VYGIWLLSRVAVKSSTETQGLWVVVISNSLETGLLKNPWISQIPFECMEGSVCIDEKLYVQTLIK